MELRNLIAVYMYVRNSTSISLFSVEFNGKNGVFEMPEAKKINPVVREYFLHIPVGEHLIHRCVFYNTLSLMIV